MATFVSMSLSGCSAAQWEGLWSCGFSNSTEPECWIGEDSDEDVSASGTLDEDTGILEITAADGDRSIRVNIPRYLGWDKKGRCFKSTSGDEGGYCEPDQSAVEVYFDDGDAEQQATEWRLDEWDRIGSSLFSSILFQNDTGQWFSGGWELDHKDEDFVLSAESCIVGVWLAPYEQGCSNTETNTLYFSPDGTGKIQTVDCTGMCPKESNFVGFTYEAGADLTINFGYGETCGMANPLNQSTTQSYDCSGDELSYDDVTWTRR